MEREEMHALMALHARELIREMEEDYQNPAAAWIESLLARRATGRLTRRHGARLVREVLGALAEIPDFPPANFLWNAAHPDVPLHCFLRIRKAPIFRILQMDVKSGDVHVQVEYAENRNDKPKRKLFIVRRGDDWKFRAEPV